MAPPLPNATIRTQVSAPLRFADGYVATARVVSFNGLVDGREHLAFGLGARVAAVTPVGGGRYLVAAQMLHALEVSRVALPQSARFLRIGRYVGSTRSTVLRFSRSGGNARPKVVNCVRVEQP